MTIRMSPLTRIEGCWVRQSYSWMDRMGRQVSPPPDYSKVTPIATSDRWPPSRLSKEKVRKVSIISYLNIQQLTKEEEKNFEINSWKTTFYKTMHHAQ